jgi:NAD(P)-dependent dehydrogenase (short-subunit alcohol dehydrogenase family)
MGQLDNKAAIITGGGTGLGAACARIFAREGASLTLVGRRRERLEDTAAVLRAAGGDVEVVVGSVAEPLTAETAATRTSERFGGIDILLNNAGIHALPNLVHEIAIDEWQRFLETDLTGPFLFTRAVVPSMVARGGGAILNVSSMTALVGLKYTSAYAAAKGGLISFTRTAAIDYASSAIRVNCICPAGMEPVDRHDMTADGVARLTEAFREAGGSPLGRAAHVDEVAELVLAIIGPFGASMTGAVIPIDGGYTAR